MSFILFSNIFLFIPVIIAGMKGEWLYFFFALGISIFSPTYHYLKTYKQNSRFFKFTKDTDWIFAVSAYIYMLYFVIYRVEDNFKFLLGTALILTVLFFWYGFKFHKYQSLHPWFHIVAPIVSGLIVFLS
ncbi:MAG: hypothetical protein QG644_467 [Patescibacteria group bacterium]|nr:hypothetical protein [Patescibacteria group bacterium]